MTACSIAKLKSKSQLHIRCRATPAKFEVTREMETRIATEFHLQKCTVTPVSRKQKPINNKYLLQEHTLESASSGKYLHVGVTLNWTEHICNTRVNSCKTLVLLRGHLQDCRADAKSTAYSTMLRPTLEFAARVWDPYQQTHSKYVKEASTKKRLINTTSTFETLANIYLTSF